MRALTLWQPWAYAITHLDKRVENRPWPAPAHMLGRRIAIHAGKRYEVDAFKDLKDELEIPEDAVIHRGAVVGVAHINRNVISDGALEDDQRRWWCGPYGWELSNVVPIDPVPCRGMLGLWTLPPDVLEAVLDAVDRVAR